MPQRLDGAFRAVFRQDAGAAEFQETLAGVTGNELGQLEFTFGIETAGRGRDFLPQQPICTDDTAMFGTGKRGVQNQQMVAEWIEPVGVTAVMGLEQVLPGAKFVVEHPVAHFLRGRDLGLVASEPHFKIAYTAQCRALYDGIDVTSGKQGAAGVRPSVTFRHNCMHE